MAGNVFLSKRSEMLLPDQWPTYYIKSKGCRVWDLGGNEFIDMGIMGIGIFIDPDSVQDIDDEQQWRHAELKFNQMRK